jgi:hypothetical protein
MFKSHETRYYAYELSKLAIGDFLTALVIVECTAREFLGARTDDDIDQV